MELTKRELKFCLPAMGNQDVRYYLNGVYFDTSDTNTLKLVATDGHRIHTIDTGNKLPEDFEAFIMPAATVKELCKGRMNTLDDTIVIDGTTSATLRNVTIVFKPIEGRYPQCKHLIHNGDEKPIENLMPVINPKYFNDALKSFDLVHQTKEVIPSGYLYMGEEASQNVYPLIIKDDLAYIKVMGIKP